jgi:polar amino acid transport system substrate-binding protein
MLTRSTFLITFSMLFFHILTIAYAQNPLRIAYPTFPPFFWATENGEMKGFFYEIITEAVEKRMAIPVLWKAYPWTRCQKNLKDGKDDAILTVPTAERSVYTVTHENPFYLKSLKLFTYSDHSRIREILQIKEIADIKRGNFSVITYRGNGWHKENIDSKQIKTHETSYLENVWRMLAAKRGDIVIEWPHGAWPDIKRLELSDKIIETSVTLSEMPFHMLIRKDSTYVNILPEFNDVIKKMYEDDTIANILSKYY